MRRHATEPAPTLGRAEDEIHHAPASHEEEIKEEWRRAWHDHVALTRRYLLARLHVGKEVAVLEDLPPLLANQDVIGDLFEHVQPGSGAGVASLLKEHIALAGEVIEAVIAFRSGSAGSSGPTFTALRHWYENAYTIALALAKLNVGYFGDLQRMMRAHLEATTEEVQAAVAGREADSLGFYRLAQDQATEMADAFAAADRR